MGDDAASSLPAFCRALPKVELHAHIHGCVRPATLAELLQEQARLTGCEPRRLPEGRSLDQCFEMFDLIHQVVVSRCALRRIVIEAVEDFAAENVKYLELRSTPRALERDGLSREDYVAEVVSALDECHARLDLDIQVRLILSINRNQPVHVAEETVALACKWRFDKRCPYIVGIDLSGHSERSDSEFHRFEPVLERARAAGLKLTVHFAEHFDDAEAARILDFRPDRVGHACCLSDALYDRMVQLGVPVEVCLTSNVHTLARFRSRAPCCERPSERLDVSSGLCACGFEAHPHRRLLTGEIGAPDAPAEVYPLSLSTDDHGVLGTSLSTEFLRAAAAFALSRQRLAQLARAPVSLIFDPSQAPALTAAFAALDSCPQLGVVAP